MHISPSFPSGVFLPVYSSDVLTYFSASSSARLRFAVLFNVHEGRRKTRFVDNPLAVVTRSQTDKEDEVHR